MDATHLPLLCAAIALVALLYSSVGHGGASGYIATMTLFGFAAATIKPVALILNIFVACIGTVQFWRARHFSWPLFWPFALLSVPAAFLGGWLHTPTAVLKTLVGIVLFASAGRLLFCSGDRASVSPPARPLALGLGGGIGFLSGLTGTGGGIFLTPLLLFCGWSKTKKAAAVSALFILVNSLAGLGGWLAAREPIPTFAWMLVVSAGGGGLVGSHLGSRRLPVRAVQLLLAAVLVIAGCKLIFTK